jgi:AraC family transcriptional regulator, regulatory protein of adaptative response / methylated-DNA-[protein]-cysteine methyltransferase
MDLQSENCLRYANGAGELNLVGASYGPQGSGARIAYAISPSQFGLILIGATARGICWVGLHESAAYLASELRGDLPKAEVDHADDELRDITASVAAFIGGSIEPLVLPLDIRATPFQLAVWRELCAIPPGNTRSYGEIARRLGRSKSARAVGYANGLNPLAILIPCHRAVRADGRLTGYRWGLEYKRRLLEYEHFVASRSTPAKSGPPLSP